MSKYSTNKPKLQKFLTERKLGTLVDWDALEFDVSIDYDDRGHISFGRSAKREGNRYYVSLYGVSEDFQKEFQDSLIA